MEVELQYAYEGDEQTVVPTELAGLNLAGSDTVTITDAYFDSERLELRTAGCNLRIRFTEGHGSVCLTWKGPARRTRRGGKVRPEVELPLRDVPASGDEIVQLLQRHGIDRLVEKATGLNGGLELHEIGRLRNARSRHTYVTGLHRLELTWDHLEYPTGPAELRVEVEVKSKHAGRYLERADSELRRLFDGELRPAKRGKVQELCTRLYPELLS